LTSKHQREAAWTENDLPIILPAATESTVDSGIVEPPSDCYEFPPREDESAPRVRQRYDILKLAPLLVAWSVIKKLPKEASFAWLAIFGLCTAMIFCLSILAVEYIQKRATDLNEKPLVRIPMARFPVARQENSLAGENSQRVLPVAAPPAALTPTTLSSADQPSSRNPAARQWSVQITAAPAKEIADGLAQQLKTNGYDGYVLQAEVKGQTYFRVRVGHFASQEEAESLRQLLADEEDYRSAYLAYD
jgi:cell division septation protein DedD